jgi:SAM-dependent methyltransferase
MANFDQAFTGSVPETYEKYLVPLIFETYAEDLARRAVRLAPARVLEIAAGTGVVTRRLAAQLPVGTTIVATDLNPAMLEHAKAVGTPRPVEWQPADAQSLPFPDGSFDLVVCQFGVMFFPNRVKAYAEMRRVLAAGGTLLFNVWDNLKSNEFADAVTAALKVRFPQDPPLFLSRTPYGYHDTREIASDLARGGFDATPTFDTVSAHSRAPSPREPAIAFVQGTPLRSEIEERSPGGLEDATEVAAAEIRKRFGSGPVDADIRAHIVSVRRSDK